MIWRRDAQCGFKAITSKVARELAPTVSDNGWFMDTELLVKAERFGYRVFDLPVRWVDDPDSRVKIFKTATEDIRGLMGVRQEFRNGKQYNGLTSKPRGTAAGVMDCDQ